MSFETKLESLLGRLKALHEEFHDAVKEYSEEVRQMDLGQTSILYGTAIERMVRLDLVAAEAGKLHRCTVGNTHAAEGVIESVAKARGLDYEQAKKDVDECYLKLDPDILLQNSADVPFVQPSPKTLN
jgi:hypothetical protein